MRALQAQGAERAATALMLTEAASLAAMSALHLPNEAGVAEAIICLVLLAGVTALLRRTAHARTAARLAVGFAILGFLGGLHFTIQTGGLDLAYHLTVLPLLVLTELILLAPRSRRPGS
ncbi:MAG TPA: hypothetical protein VKV27_01340 [Solirubrobacteraceae bacterium]|nr:hypothetical protein [Solirubrobacteraceae bacterium]